jgi:hypothetical protein
MRGRGKRNTRKRKTKCEKEGDEMRERGIRTLFFGTKYE